MMRHQLLGPSGLRVSELCLGADGGRGSDRQVHLLGARRLEQFQDVLGSLEVGLAAEVVSPDG
jgi:aryl-alcohol dehydrogenase-like predicted oxidoreductase